MCDFFDVRIGGCSFGVFGGRLAFFFRVCSSGVFGLQWADDGCSSDLKIVDLKNFLRSYKGQNGAGVLFWPFLQMPISINKSQFENVRI